MEVARSLHAAQLVVGWHWQGRRIVVLSLLSLLVGELVVELHFHLVAEHVELGRVDERVHVLTLRNLLLRSDLLSWKVVWHPCLAVRHVDLKGCISCICIQDSFRLLRAPCRSHIR